MEQQNKKQPITIELFSVGSDFQTMSGNKMSPIYQAKTFKIWSFLDVKKTLDDGNTVNIRPATQPEMNWAWKELGKLTHENFKNNPTK
jgi:hypothetical protein